MASLSVVAQRRLKSISRISREYRMILKGLASTDHPVLAHVVPVRRCNLTCTYCNEYDRDSQPVPIEAMLRRIDRLGELGTTIITISGGEPLLHPELEQIVARARRYGMITGLITNGYLIVPERVKRLNEAGLDHLQISIDNVQPDEVSKKSLKVLDKKLEVLRDYAEFHVNINSVVGSGVKHPEDALTIARRALELGFSATVGVVHNGRGQLVPLGDEEKRVFHAVRDLAKHSYAHLKGFQENIAEGKPNDWRCRAGSRYLYICEDGRVHYCSQQRGYPGIPLEKYTKEHMRREFLIEKSCAPNCTVSCVHQVSYMDSWRAPQIAGPATLPAPGLLHTPARTAADLVQIEGD
jgi:MoaA/NifB/PqqE/SkfB family radical SAM enzyme